MKTYLYRASNLKSTISFWPLFHSGSQFLASVKNCRFWDLFIILIIVIIIILSSSTSSDVFSPNILKQSQPHLHNY